MFLGLCVNAIKLALVSILISSTLVAQLLIVSEEIVLISTIKLMIIFRVPNLNILKVRALVLVYSRRPTSRLRQRW